MTGADESRSVSPDGQPTGLEAERVQLRAIGRLLYPTLNSEHDRVEMQVSVAGGVLAGRTRVHRLDGSLESIIGPVDAFEAAEVLRDAMHRRDAGTWFTAVFTVTAAGKMSASYDYDHEPELGHFAAEAYRADFDEFPRTPENTPHWLAAILAGAPTGHDLVGRADGSGEAER
ncbi:hypothetical protein [Frigoribacterium sp. R86507]|uniref:hypothetical protein n=1 Tax=Frigoribacterium sp. R86507 TaxID=3093850 RepID=UPI0037CBA2C2